MSKAIKFFLITVVFLSFGFSAARASHLSGQDFTYVFVDSAGGIYHYSVTLSIYQDCLNGQPEAIAEDNPAYLAVYTGAGGFVRVDSVSYSSAADSMPITTTAPCAMGGYSAPLCISRKTFTLDYHLPLSATGYNITYQRCCLNPFPLDINDPNDLGISCSVSIPPSGTTTHNNSAVFSHYPPFVIAVNTPLAFDFSATDADGDSLSYALCTAYSGDMTLNVDPDPPAAPPFTPLPYLPPFSYSNPMTCAVPLAINPVTGMLTGLPNAAGQYLVTICCSEWRHGVLINTVQREFEFNVANCILAVPVASAGVNEILYPNPATSTLTISSARKINTIAITNLLGRVVFTHTYNSDEVMVNVADLLAGVYFVKINGSEVRKFVKE